MSSGTITLRRPRVRGVEERFESRVLPLFARRTKELGELIPELWGVNGLVGGGLSGSQGSRSRSAEATDGRR